MATMISEVYDAVRAAEGVGGQKARKAVEAVASYENRFASFDLKIAEIKGTLKVMQWMLATVVAGIVALLVRAFF